MTGEFTNWCSHYYRLTTRLTERSEYLEQLVENAPYYNGEINLGEIDEIIAYYREAQDVNEEVLQLTDELKQTARAILEFMNYFQIPRNKVLTGEIPEQLEYQLWATEDDEIGIRKTNDLEPDPLDENTIIVKPSDDCYPPLVLQTGKRGKAAR